MTALRARFKNSEWSGRASHSPWSAGALAPAALVRCLGLSLGLSLLIAAPAFAQGVQGAINSPPANGTVMQPFTVTGWAIHGPGSGTGIDIVRVYGCPSSCTLWGTATYGVARPDVAAAYGQQYLNSGYTFTKAGLTPGSYYVKIEAHSTVNGAWYLWGRWINVQAGPEHTLELPAQGQAVTSPVSVSGWALDASAPSGTGVDLVSVWNYLNPGSGTAPTPVGPNGGTATYGGNRPDVAASHGERFRYSGYTQTGALAAGQHLLGVSARSSHTQVWTVRTRTIYANIPTVPLTLDRPGTGTGGVTASGLSCPGGSPTQALPCGASYPLHTVVTLTAVPDPGSTFDGWGGACTGGSTCQVTMANARYVTATFAKLPDTIATRYYHTDMLGSVRAITDETGAVVIRHDYRPFGEDTQPLTGDPVRFAGKHLDPETAQQYFDARYYRQTWGRFTTVDPLHVGAAMTDPQQWNRYAYARNNPMKYADPNGEFVIVLVWLGGGSAGGGAAVSAGIAAGIGASWGWLKGLFGLGGNPSKSTAPGPNGRDESSRPTVGSTRTPPPSRPGADQDDTVRDKRLDPQTFDDCRAGRGGMDEDCLVTLMGRHAELVMQLAIPASGTVRILQAGGRSLKNATVNALNKAFGKTVHPRQWGRALEDLKKAHDLPREYHGKIGAGGEYMDELGNIIDNIMNYLP